MKRLLIAALAFLAIPALAQVTLTVTKSGSDVVLTFSGGTGPYTVIRAAHPTMTERLATVATGASSPVTDTGGKTRGNRIEYYQVSDSTAPTVAITTPTSSFTSANPCICSTGTASAGATVVYVNSHQATGTTTWSECADTTGAPIAVQADPKQSSQVVVTAACVDASLNWGTASVSGSYTGTITNRVPCKARKVGE